MYHAPGAVGGMVCGDDQQEVFIRHDFIQGIGKSPVQDLDDPGNPSYLVTGLTDGNTYWFAVTAISGSGAESEFFDQTCITVNGRIVECTDDDDNGTTVFISCFITASGF